MKISEAISIEAPKAAVWKAITDIEHAGDMISAIRDLTLLHRPPEGIDGLKWTETREMFGQEATETMWITDSAVSEYYATRAESHGSVYTTRLSLEEHDGGTLLRMSFCGAPQTLVARVLSFVMAPLIGKSMRKALREDLEDIKAFVERDGGRGA